MLKATIERGLRAGLENTKNIIAILSGKGGVGKSTIVAQFAIYLWKLGFSVGVLDVDLCGPSIPRMLGIEKERIHQCPEGWLPVVADGPDSNRLRVASMAFFLDNPDSAVVWRGPRKSGMIEKLLNSVCWGKLDILLIDTPPGTSDEHISVLEQVQRTSGQHFRGAIVVTTPQRVSICDVRRELAFCSKAQVPVIGIIENMSGYKCSCCGEVSKIFSSGGGQALAEDKNLPFLGRLPIDPSLTASLDGSSTFEGKQYIIDEISKINEQVMKLCRLCVQEVH